jgi:hypothetical protein
MSTTDDDRKSRVFALMKRFNETGALLPDPDTFDPSDPAEKANAMLVLVEMAKVQVEIDRLMAQAADP